MRTISRGKLFGAKLMAEGQMKWEDGYFTVMGMPGIMLPLSAYLSFQKILEKKLGKEEGGKKLYEEFKLVGNEIAKAEAKKYHKEGSELVICTMELSSFAGFGKFVVIDLSAAESKCLFQVQNSNIAQSYGKSDVPSCHIMRGLAAGITQIAFEREDMECIEKTCKCTGYQKCSFKVKPKDVLVKEEDQELLTQQIQ